MVLDVKSAQPADIGYEPMAVPIGLEAVAIYVTDSGESVRFVNSREGQEIVMRSGVYRLPQREIERNLSRLSGERMAYK